MALTLDEARAAVKRGAAFFDEARPGWKNKMDSPILNVVCGKNCPAAQVTGKFFSRAIEELGINVREAITLGLACGMGIPNNDNDVKSAYRQLTEVWKEILAETPPAEEKIPAADKEELVCV